jgi:hypothetical protein
MNSFSTELFKVSFEKPKNVKPYVTLQRGHHYSDAFELGALGAIVDEHLQAGRLSPKEAIKVLTKGAQWFILAPKDEPNKVVKLKG